MTTAQDTLDREVQQARSAARLRVEAWHDDEDDAYVAGWERGARAGLAHLWPLLEAAQAVLPWLEEEAITGALYDTDFLDALRAAIEQATGETP